MRKFSVSVSLALVAVLGMMGGDAKAENTKGRWHLGGGVSWVSTEDDIRSNAAYVLFDQPGPDGVPDSGDETIKFYDPRPDDTLSRETTIEEGFKFDFNASYGITPWFSVQLDTGYYQADIVQFDTYVEQRYFFQTCQGSGAAQQCANNFDNGDVALFTQSQPITAGQITQIPISLTGVFRFRRDSPLNPYVGIGGGLILVDTQESAALRELNDSLSQANISSKGTYNYIDFLTCQGSGCPPFQGIRLEVDDSTEWHVVGGVEYFFNSHLSVYFDGRYTFARNDLRINVDGADQTNFNYQAAADTLPYCTDAQFDAFPFPSGFSRTTDGLFKMPGPDGVLDTPDDVPGCRPGDNTRLQDSRLVQGGSISLSGLVLGVGVRWYF